jgi:hypothetical protein
MKPVNRATLERRQFLRALGAGAAVAATAPLVTETKAAEGETDKRRSRYRETVHIKAYYRVNRYPS